ncbi:MAG: response regulator transcription factor [Burkholderiales bacterium]|nr:response regulator transcription factor [Opitutaceae bacterium]
MSHSIAASIYIIEEFALIRQLINNLVKSLPGYTIVGRSASLARGGEACLRHKPDVVILGWNLPDGTGDRLLRDVAPALPGTRWLVVTPQESSEAVPTAIGLGAQGVLVKESDPATFRQALARLVGGGSFYCPRSSRLLLDFVRNRTRSNPDGLTDREVEILRHFAAGAAPKSIADLLRISVKTVQNQLSSIRHKLGVQETADLVRYAIRIGVA